ncbi:MAG: tyrosine-type recombinase/integrase [Candidatus Binatia bacterium]
MGDRRESLDGVEPEPLRALTPKTPLKLLAKAGVGYIRVHDLRHTFASLLIQNGESLAYVKEQLGHHSIKITVDTYGHLIPRGNKAAVDRLDGLENATIRDPDATGDLSPAGENTLSA